MAAGPTSPPVPPTARRGFAEARDATTLQLLFKAARLANERALARVAAGPTGARMRPAHTSLLPHLDFDGVRLTDLAAKVGTSKQAVGQLIDDLETMGMVERIPDPTDGRTKRIRYSRQGHAALMHGLGVLRELETSLAADVGARRMRELNRTLALVVRALGGNPDPR